MNDSDIQVQKFIDDLYKIDPSLRAQEPELRKAVTEVLKSKPDALADERFREDLRAKLLKISAEKKTVVTTGRPAFRPWTFATATAGIGMIAIAIMIARPDGQLTPSTGGTSVAVLAPGAFGDISTASTAGREAAGLGAADSSVRQQGAGGFTMPAPEIANGDAKLIMPPQDWHPVYVKYTYGGEPLTFSESSVDVYRRAQNARPAAPSSLLTAPGLPIDLSKFDGRLDNYSVTQEKEFGYSVFVNTVEGSVSISQNWLRWPHPENLCTDETCYQQYRLTPESIPSDAEAIQIADSFLAEYGIDRSAYGQPVVQNNEWMVAYAQAEDKRFAYVPESVTLVYPLLIEGSPSYDEGGNPAGLYVNVSARHRKVDNLGGLAGKSFEKSAYPAIASSEILSIVERGGVYGPTSYEPNAEVVEATVGAPERVLLRTYAPSKDGIAYELFVPALRFPVTSAPSRNDIYVPKAIVVPLAESLAKPPVPQPMPLMMEGAVR